MKKVHVNVGTIGHIDHGKTTLTAAILAVQAAKGLAEVKSYRDIAKGGTVRDENKTVTIITSHVQYETAARHYAHIEMFQPRFEVRTLHFVRRKIGNSGLLLATNPEVKEPIAVRFSAVVGVLAAVLLDPGEK